MGRRKFHRLHYFISMGRPFSVLFGGFLGVEKMGGEEASEALESPGREAKMGVST
jgi:hypothetical protein